MHQTRCSKKEETDHPFSSFLLVNLRNDISGNFHACVYGGMAGISAFRKMEDTMITKMFTSIFMALSLMLMSHAANAADKTPDEMVREAKSSIREVTVAEVRKMIDSHEKIVLLDVRDRDEFETGHIPGAINISRGTLEFMVNMMIPDKSSRIIVYCGVDLRAPLATRTLNEMGYRNAVNIIGGLKSWKEAGYQLQK
jgi:rhodanese-related sulfurtransferase